MLKGESKRNSNIELYRIITMLLIVAHHYVVNSGLTGESGPLMLYPQNYKSLFFFVFGMWGKIGINCFVMITGYYMCKSAITLKKFMKLLLEIEFYKIVIYFIFLLTGYADFSIKECLKSCLPISEVAQNFSGCYLLFFLCIPFLNILIRNLTEKQHGILLLLAGFIYTFFGTVPKLSVTMNYVSWFIVVYFIGSYIRLYPKAIYKNGKIWGSATAICIMLSVMSVISLAYLYPRIHIHPFFF
ncbi:MAG: hypothetical protein IIT65_05710, partial [Lachnospiraceae bacterium]|nr:hypothetical protein [Lachnospiraceae bacterium]